MTAHGDGFSASADSIDGSSHLLLELASLLYTGRPDGDLSVMARTPRAHHEVAEKVESFARFTNDQFLDTVSLLTALSTKLKVAGGAYAETDHNTEQTFDKMLSNGHFVRPEDRLSA